MNSFDSVVELSGGRRIGGGHPCFVVAELSGNHNGQFERAADIIRAAKNAGADAVKLQTYTADTLTIDCDKPSFRVTGANPWQGRLLYDLYEDAHTPWDWHADLFELGRELGIEVFSTPFDNTAVDFLEGLSVALYKIASFEMVDLELVRYVGQKGKPTIMSTGMASEEEIQEAAQVFADTGNTGLILLKCTSAYPAPLSEMNVRTMPVLAQRFGLPVGLSDHCLDHVAAVSAVALGACVVEKHLTIDRSKGGVDSSFSLNPDEFADLVRQIRSAEQVLGESALAPGATELDSVTFRRSIFVVTDVEQGEELTRKNVRVIRPGQGLAPKHLPVVLGRKATRRLERGTPLDWDMIES